MKNRRLQEILKEFPDDYNISIRVSEVLIGPTYPSLDVVDIKEDTDKVILFIDEGGPVST